MTTSLDSLGSIVSIGDTIKVLEIDSRLTKYLPEDEVEELNEIIGEALNVNKINTDGSMVVSKSWVHPEEGLISGHDIAIFPNGSLLVK